MSPLSSELDLLLACARVQMLERDRERARAAIAKGVDWARVVRLADAHGLLPLLHAQVVRRAVLAPPEPAAALHARAAINTRRSLALTSELVALLRGFGAQQIPVLPMKGPILAEYVYGSVALRQMRDLDLLFRESDLPRVRDLLEERGYRVDATPSRDGDVTRRAFHHLAAISPARQVRLELHYFLLSPRGRRQWRLETLAPRLRERAFMGLQVPFLSPGDLLVFLCEHGADHAWSRLEWLATAAELMRAGHVRDSPEASAAVADFRAGRRLSATLLLADELLGPTGGGVAVTGDGWCQAANRAVVHRLIREPARMRETPLERVLYQLRTDPGVAARLHRLWQMLRILNLRGLLARRFRRAGRRETS